MNLLGSKEDPDHGFKCGWGPDNTFIFILDILGSILTCTGVLTTGLLTTTGVGIGVGGAFRDGVAGGGAIVGGVVCMTTCGGFPVSTEWSICSALKDRYNFSREIDSVSFHIKSVLAWTFLSHPDFGL